MKNNIKSKINVNETNEFLQLFFNRAQSGSIVLTTFPGTQTSWLGLGSLKEIPEKAAKIALNNDIYFNLCLQDFSKAKKMWAEKNPGKKFAGRGYVNSVLSVPGFWLDVDIKGPNHAEDNLPETEEEAIKLVEIFPLKPTCIVNSGGGLHCYWLFEKPWILADELALQKAKKLSKAFQNYIIAEGLKSGWKIDQTGDLTRMLRLPGTLNHKGEPASVRIIAMHKDRYYSPQDFEELLNDSSAETSTHTNKFDPAEIEPIIGGCAFMDHCIKDAVNLPEPHWFTAMSIIPKCKDGVNVAHEISRPYPRYSEQETDKKIEHASNAGPRTCQSINDLTGGIYCNECKHYGKITSPIQLGNKFRQKEIDINEAKEIAMGAITSVKNGNFGAHLMPEAINAFAYLAYKDLPEFTLKKKELQVAGAPIRDFNSAVNKAKLKIVKKQTVEQVNRLGKDFNDAPYNDLIVPYPYNLCKSNGVQYEPVDEDGNLRDSRTVAHDPVIITGKSIDINTGQEIVNLAWHNRSWHEKSVDREVVANSRKLIELAGSGFPVNSNNANDLVAYITELEAANKLRLPQLKASSNLGWQGKNGELGFLLDNRLINLTEDGQLETDANNTSDIHFRGQTPGDDQIAGGFHQLGEFKDWLNAISVIKDFPRVLFMFYASFAPVLLKPLNISNFIVELANRTSTGKTTALRIAASVWGCPDEKLPNSIVGSWDATNVYIERTCSILSGLPLILDDSKRSKNSKQVADVMYLVANGRGRGRGNKTSLAFTKTWRTILLSTGETPATLFTNDGGTKGRVIEVTGKPFGETSEKTRNIVTELNNTLKYSYGHAGPLFAEYVVNNKSKWPAWKEELVLPVTLFWTKTLVSVKLNWTETEWLAGNILSSLGKTD